ncbi:MAG: hypothetical protein IB618_01830 [Candidatus Pacearchaeota archaeon]|nr:MAG: hypothetical protein IB618_01830 [Candidatus Pacearchaeota archaeon]
MWPFKKKKKKEKEIKPHYVKICPRCHSIDIQISHQGGLSGLTALGLPTVYRCKNCGYRSHAFPEIDLNEMKRKQKIKKE